MALLSTLSTSVLASAATMPPPTNAQPSNAPTLYVPDIKARNAVIFGTIATALTMIGIIIAGATLRIAYQTHQADTRQDANNVGTGDPDMEMATIDGNRPLSQTSTVGSAVEQGEP